MIMNKKSAVVAALTLSLCVGGIAVGSRQIKKAIDNTDYTLARKVDNNIDNEYLIERNADGIYMVEERVFVPIKEYKDDSTGMIKYSGVNKDVVIDGDKTFIKNNYYAVNIDDDILVYEAHLEKGIMGLNNEGETFYSYSDKSISTENEAIIYSLVDRSVANQVKEAINEKYGMKKNN